MSQPDNVEALCLPEHLRPLLAQPPPGSTLSARPWRIPRLIHGFVVSVGDVVTTDLVANGVRPHLAIVDCGTMRVVRRSCEDLLKLMKGYEVVRVTNPRSVLALEAITAVKKSISSSRRTLIVVDGEEDLLALPAMLYAPLGGFVVYGYPGRAAVIVRVTWWLKRLVVGILREFPPCGRRVNRIWAGGWPEAGYGVEAGRASRG